MNDEFTVWLGRQTRILSNNEHDGVLSRLYLGRNTDAYGQFACRRDNCIGLNGYHFCLLCSRRSYRRDGITHPL